ncbi:MAG: cytochrome d ubiquinol oxidase subunit II [Bdellovibrionales bacterium]
MDDIISSGDWLPYVFAFLMGLSMIIYAVLDGYDLGVGVLSKFAKDTEKDRMIASIGPFWDANETWLVLGVGLLLVAFPAAHGVILTSLYLPVAIMLIGLIFRGVAFDFRAKAPLKYKKRWNTAFFLGSLVTALSQGYMLGAYILGFESGLREILFCLLIGACVVAGYCLIGACWLIMKCEKQLQKKSVKWAQRSLFVTLLGIFSVSISTPLVSTRIFEKWFSFPEIFMLAPIPIMTIVLAFGLMFTLTKLPTKNDSFSWIPFTMTVGIYVLCFYGLAYSFFPYIVPDQLTIVEAASSYESLKIILIGALAVLPVLIGYTVVVYRVFHGKAHDLSYH